MSRKSLDHERFCSSFILPLASQNTKPICPILTMRSPLPEVASIRDFYAFEQHVATCRRHRGLDMAAGWYQVPVFYFSNPASVVGDERRRLGAPRQPGAGLRARAGVRDRPRRPATCRPTIGRSKPSRASRS